jgi:V/A-type H+-transporting ATPase subunit D
MAKIKLTKNELKLQRDSLKRFQRYLPTLQLKKQQLQMSVRQMRESLADLQRRLEEATADWRESLGLFSDPEAAQLPQLLRVSGWRVGQHNIAGIDVPVFEDISFEDIPVDLYETPAWFDDALAMVRRQIELRLRQQLAEETLTLLEQELRVVTQRVNLFEKVKIPEAKENIRKINITLGDQRTNSVGRSKIAKAKCALRDAALEA